MLTEAQKCILRRKSDDYLQSEDSNRKPEGMA